MNTKTAWQLSGSLLLCILSSGCQCDHPIKTPEQPGDACEGYVGLAASLGEATIACRQTIGPDSFTIDDKGRLSNKFQDCGEDPKGEKLSRVTQILSMQDFHRKLPRFQECLTDRYKRWRELFAKAGLATCPTWGKPNVVGPMDQQSALQISKMQPKLQYIPAKERQPRFDPTGNEKYVDIAVPTKTSIVFPISYPQGNDPACGDPAVCAAQCAAFLPGFVVSAGMGQVVVDPVSWYQGETVACGTAGSTDPWCPPFVHAMSVTRTSFSSRVPPGDIFGHPNRANVGEHCFRFVPDASGGPGSNYETDLIQDCATDATGTTDSTAPPECMSKCGN